MNNPDVLEQPEPPTAVRSSELVSWRECINHKLDMLAYRIWWWRWKKKFVRQPEMLIPFMDTMTRWAAMKLSPQQIEECREKWRSISRKPANGGLRISQAERNQRHEICRRL